MSREWLRDGLKRSGKAGKELADHLGMDPSAVSRMLNGGRQIKATELPFIADFLGIDPPLGMAFKKTHVTSLVNVVGIIAAGVWRETGGEVMVEDTAIPVVNQHDRKDQYALRVDGNSINKIITSGSYAICTPYWLSRSEIVDGDLVHVERRRGGLVEATIKRVRRDGENLQLHPESLDPTHTEPIEYKSDDTNVVEIIGLVIGAYKAI